MLFVDLARDVLHKLRIYTRPWMYLLAAFLICAGMLTIAGPLFFGDLPVYLAGAFSLTRYGALLDVNGNPMTHWAPLMPVLYMPIYAWGFSIYGWTRLINIAALAVYLLFTYRIILQLTRDKIVSALMVSVHIFWQPFFSIFNFPQTEPLALALLSIALFALLQLMQRFDRKYFWLLVASGFISALLRYSAIFSIGGIAVVLLFLPYYSFRKKFAVSCLYVATSMSGLALWLLRNSVVRGDIVGRTIYEHSVNFALLGQDIVRLLLTLTATKYATMGALWLIQMVSIIVYRYRSVGGKQTHQERNVYLMLLWLTALYVVLIEATHYFFDQATVISIRLIAPALYTLFIASAAAFYHFFRATMRSKVAPILLGIFLMLFLIEAASSLDSLVGTADEYINQVNELYTVRNADLSRFGQPLYSNNDEMLFFAINQFVRHTPYKFDRYHLTPNQNYNAQKNDMVKSLNNGGAIIYFSKPFYEEYQMTLDDVRTLPTMLNVYSGTVAIFQSSANPHLFRQ